MERIRRTGLVGIFGALFLLLLACRASTPAAAPLLSEEVPATAMEAASANRAWEYIRDRHDANRDGRVTRKEYGRGEEAFARLDRDGNGHLEEGDFETAGDMRSRRMREGRARGARPRGSGAPEGKEAPDFTLEPLHGGEPVTLSSFAGKKPVALIFGSYT